MREFYEFYYNMSVAYFISDCDSVFMDKSRHVLDYPAESAGKDVYISLNDLEKIYGPYMEVTAVGDGARIEMNDVIVEVKSGCSKVKSGEKIFEAEVPVKCNGGVIFVPVGAVMQAFDKMVTFSKDRESLPERAWSRNNHIVAVCDKYEYREVPGKYVVEPFLREKFEFDQAALTHMNINLNGKYDGELYQTYWFPMAKKVMPYALYMPTGYDPEKPSKMVVSLHGAGLGEEYIYSLSKNMMQFYCEKFNYIFLAPGACTMRSFYGALVPPIQTPLPEIISDKANPLNVDEEEAKRRSLGEYCVLAAIDEVKRLYNIDSERVFLMGNSMGSAGTYYLSNKYPQLFRAIAPSGGCLHFELMDLEPWRNMPIRIVGGTEDGGWNNIKAGFKILKDAGLNAELVPVGGGVHFDSWAYVLEDTFKFFEKNS